MIRQMTHSNRNDFIKSNEGFMVSGRIIPKYENGNWTYTEELFAESYFKQYEHDEMNISYLEETEQHYWNKPLSGPSRTTLRG
ncbi:hypothetical protein GCM10010912_37010 [Paenibacillus albidus]|uniref:Uncharacterized protein n=1 Tax=Paenibacillus albidus TaxID=2041023 RepID=A0A917CIB3_9BACL|nr:hypothetical protein GCM10010912_37010 [Paenibacillus albidus]